MMNNVIQLPIPQEISYVKIKASFKYQKDRLYRTLLVKPHENLFDLACIICAAFGAEFEHLFAISCKGKYYLPLCLWEEDHARDDYLMDQYTIDDLEDTFTLEYDSGDSWDFVCKIYKRPVTLKDHRKVIVLDGKGQGIWEDNIISLYAYFDGMVDPDSAEENEDLDICPPWNFEIEKYSDFDAPLDLDALQKKLDKRIEATIDILRSQFLDGEDCDEDDDFDEDDEYDEQEMMEYITMFFEATVYQQLSAVPYVKQAYQRLLKHHGEDEAFGLILDEFMKELTGLITQEMPYGTECYKKRLEKLK